MEMTVFSAVYQWVANNGIVAGVVSNFAYDSIKTITKTLKQKVGNYFSDETKMDAFVDAICINGAKNVAKPHRDVEDIYEDITGESMPAELIEKLKEWMLDNKPQLDSIAKNTNKFNIGSQNAGRDIVNVQGNMTINNK